MPPGPDGGCTSAGARRKGAGWQSPPRPWWARAGEALVLGAPQEDGFGRIDSGYLESSNVEVVQEMVDMIAALRAYEINAKAVQAAEDMADVTNQLAQ